MSNNSLIKLSAEKGFLSKDKLVGVNTSYWYLWLCELQKWLRNKHNIEIAVQWFDKGYVYAVNKKPFKANTYKVNLIDSYEQALEEACYQALYNYKIEIDD